MSSSFRLRAMLLMGAGLLTAPEVASAQSRTTFVDLQAGLGYATNPLMELGDSTSSGFGRLSAYGFHGWTTERSSTSLSAYVENNTYTRRYSNQQLFNLTGATSRKLNPSTTLFGNVGFSGDFGGQLSSRFFGIPAGAVPLEQANADNLVVVVNPDLAALNQRQYRINGLVGGSFTLSPKDSVTASFGAQRVFFSGDADELNYVSYDTAAGYQRQLSERVSVGVRAIANHADYKMGSTITSFGPQATIDARLSPDWQLSAGLGFVRTTLDQVAVGGREDNSIDLAADASLCRNLEYERMCARLSRRTQSSVIGASPVASTLGADYYRKLSARDQVQATFAIIRTGSVEELRVGSQTFYTLAGSYDRQIRDRLSAGASLAVRKLQTSGPDPRTDVGATVFIRHRFGDLR